MKILGIDPGAKGGIAIVDTTTMKIDYGVRMPTIKYRGKTLVDPRAIYQPFVRFDVAVIEWVHAMPKQGVVSSFSFGRACGAIETVALLMANKVCWVTPREWKKHFGLSSDKQESIDAAKLMYGDSYTWTFKADDGIAEAALMARWWIDEQRKLA
jgi:hypothetical protein